MSSLRSLLAVLLVAVPCALSAQQELPATVPLEFMIVMMGGYQSPSWHIGSVPDDLRGTLPLDGIGRIVGAMTGPRTGSTVVIEVEGEGREALRAYNARLEAEGWTPPLPPFENDRGGFQRSIEGFGQGMRCSEDSMVSTRSVSFDNRSFLRISVQAAENSPCRERTRSFPPRVLGLPSLSVPEGTTMLGGGVGGSDDHAQSDTPVVTTLPVGALLDHFARQLEAAGWVEQDRAEAGDVGVRRYQVMDDGTERIGALAVWRMAPDLLHAEVQLATPGEGRWGVLR